MNRLQTQAEANAYWADHEVKKWVVSLTGPKRRIGEGTSTKRLATTLVVFVSARSRDRAIACGEANAFQLQRWVSKTARLATAQDLGCVYTGKAL